MKKKRGRKSGKSFSPTQQTHLETARTIQKGSCFTCQSISVRCTFKFRSFMSLKWKKSWKEKSWKMQEHATDISNNKSGSVVKWIIHFAHQKNVSSGESRSEKKGHKTRIFRKEPKREHEIHVMQIKKHKILISNWRRNEGGRASERKEESERKKNKVARPDIKNIFHSSAGKSGFYSRGFAKPHVWLRFSRCCYFSSLLFPSTPPCALV